MSNSLRVVRNSRGVHGYGDATAGRSCADGERRKMAEEEEERWRQEREER